MKGDNQGSWLRGKIVDSKGTPHTIDFVKSIDFDDWKYVTVDIPSNVSYPITLEQIYMVETNAAKKHSGEILIDDNLEWYCPNCGNRDHDKLNVARRTCGYIGTNFWNKGRTQEIKERVIHIDNKDAEE